MRDRPTVTTPCRLIATYLCSLGVTIILVSQVDSFAYATDPKCQDCSEGIIDQNNFVGGGECQHGPENDTAACFKTGVPFSATAACWELNTNKNNPATGLKCECFKCYGAKGCEPVIQWYVAWCGPETDKNKGSCKTKPGTGPATDWLRRESKTVTMEKGDTCAHDANPGSGTYLIKTCGGAPFEKGATGNHLGCKTNGTKCVAGGGWNEVVKGVRRVCDK